MKLSRRTFEGVTMALLVYLLYRGLSRYHLTAHAMFVPLLLAISLFQS